MASGLVTEPNLNDTDGFYERLIAAHEGLDAEASRRLNAKLVLLLANHIGNRAVLDEALRIARTGSDRSSRTP